MSLVLAIGHWVFTMSFSRETAGEEETQELSSECEIAFGFQPPAGEE